MVIEFSPSLGPKIRFVYSTSFHVHEFTSGDFLARVYSNRGLGENGY